MREPRSAASPSPSEPARPSPGTGSRIVAVDVTRGLALLGMAAVHVLDTSGADGGPNLVAYLAAGRSATAFAFVAGISLAFVTGGSRGLATGRARGALAAVATRGVLIGLLGLALAYLQAVNVILSAYGLMFLLALPMLRLGPRALALLSVSFAVLGPVAVVGLARAGALTEDVGDPTLTNLLTEPGTVLEVLLFSGQYPVAVYLGYLCAGLAIGRLDLGSRRLPWLLVVGGVTLALLGQVTSALLLMRLGGMTHLLDHLNGAPSAEAAAEDEAGEAEDAEDAEDVEDEAGDEADDAEDEPVSDGPDDPTTGQDLLWEADGQDSWWYLALAAPHANTTPDAANTVGSALAVLGVTMLLCRLPSGVRLLRPLADLGSMPLTLYTGHVLLLTTGVLEDEPVLLYAVMVLGMAVFAVLWRAAFGQGPLERLLAAASGRVRALTERPRRPGGTPSRE